MPISQDNRELLQRLKWLRILFVLVFAALVVRLWSLSVLEFERYESLAERNRIRVLPELAPRGLVYDREGRVIIDNVYGFNLLLFRDEVQDLRQTVRFLERGLNLNPETVLDRFQVGESDFYRPLVVKENLSMEEIAFLLARQSEHPELRILKQPRRMYRYGVLASHVTGYVGEVSRSQLEKAEFRNLKVGDIVGQSGIERSYNSLLTGADGRRRVLVDSRGKILEELAGDEPSQGEDLMLTLDLDLQAAAEAQLGEGPGAVVAFNPETGEILAMASKPSFDPNQFAMRISPKEWGSLLENPDRPLQNRAIQSAFSPGSTFKLIVALAGLEQGIITPETRVYCNGSVTLYGNSFRCWKRGGHGFVNLKEAIQHSCNVYFYQLGQKLGLQQIAEFSRRLGLGASIGLNLVGEAMGLVPSEEWKQQTSGEPWYPGETISLAIGQGPLLVTPLQLARAVGMISTGKAPQLHLVKRDVEAMAPSYHQRLITSFSEDSLTAIRDAMWSSVNEGGTGRAARVANFDVCGKTGTAQTISQASRQKLSKEEAALFEPNSWFVGFAPRENPEIVVAVVVERGGSGGARAAPIAGEVLKVYHQKNRKVPQSGVEVASQGSSEKSL